MNQRTLTSALAFCLRTRDSLKEPNSTRKSNKMAEAIMASSTSARLEQYLLLIKVRPGPERAQTCTVLTPLSSRHVA